MRIRARGGIVVAGVVVALVIGIFVVVGGLIAGNAVDSVSEGIEGSSEIISGPSLESTLDDAIADFGADAPVVGLTIRPEDMVYEVLVGSEVTERRIAVQETSRFDQQQGREISGATIDTRDGNRKARGGERKVTSPTLGDLDPAAQDRMAAAAGVPAGRLTAELDGDVWLVETANGRTLEAALDGTAAAG